jgi:hypothetical protein
MVSALRLLVIASELAIAGIVLIIIGTGWSLGVGIAVLLIASVPGVVGVGLLTSGTVARWASRHKLFA